MGGSNLTNYWVIAMNEDEKIGVQAPVIDTGWKNPPKLSDLKLDYQDASVEHTVQCGKISTWLDNLHVRGKAIVQTPKNSSKIVPKLIRKQAEWRYASLSEPFLSTDDLFNVTPTTWEDREAAMQNQLILNNQFSTKIDKVSFIDAYVRAAVDQGTVIVRVGWAYEDEEYKEDVPVVEYVVNEAYAQLHQELHQLMQDSPSQYATDIPEELKIAHELSIEQQVPIEPKIVGKETVTKTRVLKNHPTVEVCDYRNVFIDPTCNGDMAKAAFVIYSYETSLSDLKKSSKYKNLEYINVTSSSVLNTPDHASSEGNKSFTFNDKARKKLTVYEYWGYWDFNGNGKAQPFVCAWIDDVMIRMEENPFPDKKIPFVVVPYLPVRKSVYGEPDGALLEDNQKIAGAVTRGMIDLLGKSANSQMGIRKDMLDVTNRRKFDAGQDYEFNPNVDPRQGVHQHAFPEIPVSAQFMLSLMNMEAESMTGVKSFSSGVSGQSLGDVAAGVRGALDAASKRELGILRRLSNGIIQIGRKFISMNAEFLSEEEVVRVSNDEFVQVRRDDLGGEFDLKLSISTAEEDNNKADQLAFMFQTIGPNGDVGMTKMILADIARLRKMPDLAKRIEAYEPAPDPLAQRKAELEVQLLEAKLANEMAEAQLKQAQAGTESVKATNIKADTDQKTLDFIEQESGVKQERAKELHGEQARSQAKLKEMERQFELEDRQMDAVKEYMKSRNTAM